MNCIIIIGRLTRQPELRVTQGGTPVTTVTVAVDRRRSADRDKGTDFIDCVIWGKTAEAVCQYMDKGRQVGIKGRLQSRAWETQDGQKRRAWEVVADEVEFLGGRRESDA
jgi:single-strand DNA-binding protein